MKEVLFHMKAEDLPVLTILANENNSSSPRFTGRLDTNSSEDHKIDVGQEVRDWKMG